jgi:prepilin-type N-terminal cleavage/methylation domain-containing protein/prepilin-type processing-associated H-X9-DG protein
MNRRRAVTLIELLVVLVIIGILVALLMPAVHRIRAAASRVSCASNLKQIGHACHLYHQDAGSFPPGYASWPSSDPMATAPGWGWASYLLPYLEQASLQAQVSFGVPIEDPANALPRLTLIPVYLCPADVAVPPAFAITDATGKVLAEASPISYAATYGIGELDQIPGPNEGMFYRNSHVSLAQVTDGTSSTLMIGDRAWSHAMAPWAGAINTGILHGGPANPWRNSPEAAYPAPNFCLVQTNTINNTTDCDGALDDFFSAHLGGVNVVFADGSVHFLSESINRSVLLALATRAAGEVINEADY